MATHKGCEGVLKVIRNSVTEAITEVKDWTLTETTDVIDASSIGNCSRIKRAGMKAGTGSLTAWWQNDASNFSQGQLLPGEEVELELYPIGDDTDKTKINFNALVTEKGISGSVDGLIEITISFETTGTITWSTIL